MDGLVDVCACSPAVCSYSWSQALPLSQYIDPVKYPLQVGLLDGQVGGGK